MRRRNEKRWVRFCGLGIAVSAMVAAGVMSGSCGLESKTTACEQYGLRCKEGQECAVHQPVCIDLGGCGNNKIDPGEDCDDGNIMDGDGCRGDCMSDETCGNDKLDPNATHPEQCDHGRLNGTSNDNCTLDCQFKNEYCGNGKIDPGEICDPGSSEDSADCNSHKADEMFPDLHLACKVPKCGDGYTNKEANEQCDTKGVDTSDCNAQTCKIPKCGDTITNLSRNEQCDTGGIDTEGCNGQTCRLPACGDGYTNRQHVVSEPAPGTDHLEQCDDGMIDMSSGRPTRQDTTNCDSDCTLVMCGDMHTNIAANESCDRGINDTSGNMNASGDDRRPCNGNAAGSVSCKFSICGDLHVNVKAGEQCDRGSDDTAGNGSGSGDASKPCNGDTGDEASCKFSICGDNHVNMAAGEACDVGSTDTMQCNGSSGLPLSTRCQPTRCGDNHVNMAVGEGCDRGDDDTTTCNGSTGPASCQTPACGDGRINMAAGEECDPPGGTDTSTCNGNNAGMAKCHTATCHDGYFNRAAEQCERDADCPMSQKCNSCRCS